MSPRSRATNAYGFKVRVQTDGPPCGELECPALLILSRYLGGFALREVALQHLCNLVVEIAVGEHGRDLKVQSERAVVEIGGTDGRDIVVDQHRLRVQEACLLTIDGDAFTANLIEKRVAGKLDKPIIDAGRQQYTDIHASQFSQLQDTDYRFIGNEIGTDDPYALVRMADKVSKEQAAGLKGIGRPAGQNQYPPVCLLRARR